MPHRAPKYQSRQRRFKLGVGLKSAATYKEVSAAAIDQSVKDEEALVIPKSLAGKITHKRYTQLRKMGMQMGDIGALALMFERGEFPGELLFSGKKKQLMHKKFKKLRIKTRKELNARWIVMRDEMVDELKAGKKKLEKKNKKAIAAKKKKVVKKPKRSELNETIQRKTVKKPKKKVVPPSSYTDGDAPEINSPHA